MARQQETATGRKDNNGHRSEPVAERGDYHVAIDRVMFEIEALRGTGSPRLALAEERLAS